MSGSLTALVVAISIFHAARFRGDGRDPGPARNQVEGTAGNPALLTPCAVCGERASRRSYDGLDPAERRDPHTGRAYSTGLARYQPRCAAH